MLFSIENDKDNNKNNIINWNQNNDNLSRRKWMQQNFMSSMVPLMMISTFPSVANSQDEQIESSSSLSSLNNNNVFVRETSKFRYTFSPPINCKQTKKPLQTHLDEVNFKSETIKGYEYGITIDPVRINSLKEFGSPEQVAARVVTAEVNRDGIFEVTLLTDPYESKDGAYILEYLSDGKRGKKHFINKIFISNQSLYVLTAQAKEESFLNVKDELMATVDTFTI